MDRENKLHVRDLAGESCGNVADSDGVYFLLGSTQKMGAGTNVQDRLIALHHLDVPWHPSEEDRAGRYINKSSKIKAFRDSVKAESPLLNQPAQNSIDLTEFSGYNDFKVIYLLGMAFTFPADVQKGGYVNRHWNKKCGKRSRYGSSV